jgi:hypothetical protein
MQMDSDFYVYSIMFSYSGKWHNIPFIKVQITDINHTFKILFNYDV